MREYSITREGQSGIAADDGSILDEIISLTGGTYTLTVSDPEEDEPLPVETELQKLERLSQAAHSTVDSHNNCGNAPCADCQVEVKQTLQSMEWKETLDTPNARLLRTFEKIRSQAGFLGEEDVKTLRELIKNPSMPVVIRPGKMERFSCPLNEIEYHIRQLDLQDDHLRGVFIPNLTPIEWTAIGYNG